MAAGRSTSTAGAGEAAGVAAPPSVQHWHRTLGSDLESRRCYPIAINLWGVVATVRDATTQRFARAMFSWAFRR